MALAQEPAGLEGDLAACAAITDADTRLGCFDRLAARTATPFPPVAPAAAPTEAQIAAARQAVISRWDTTTAKSRIDDSQNVFLSVQSKEMHRGRYGRSEYLNLWIACRENVTSVWIYFAGEFMASGGRNTSTVTYRIDERRARHEGFTESNDNTALGLWSGGPAILFILDMFGGESMYVQATPFSESAVSGDFPIAGLETEIAALRESCHW
jgi:type VI secretion system protein VasI